jgi:hypothetical protein
MNRAQDEYPFAVQHAGVAAMAVYDRVERGLLADGYTQAEADMLMQINLGKILAQADHERAQEQQDEAEVGE